MPDAAHLAFVGGAALAGGAINAIAGGGSLITFPALLATGMMPALASATNTVALCPGYIGAAIAQRRQMAGQGRRAARVLPAGVIGGALGAVLLLETPPVAFGVVVPVLLLAAVILIGAQDRLRAVLLARSRADRGDRVAAIAVGVGAIYGGYFGAGLGVIVLAVLAIAIAEPLDRLNAFKQYVSLVVNVAAAAVFVASAPLDGAIIGVMAAGALLGGVLGGAVASRVSARALRVLVIAVGGAVSVIYFAKLLH